MSDIFVNREGMTQRLRDVLDRVDDLDQALGRRPAAPDGGIASSMIGFIAAAGGEASGVLADAERALAAIATDVLADLQLSDDEAGALFEDLADELGG